MPPGQVVVVIFNAPPAAVTVTWAVAVFEPAAFVAVRVYVVVAAGLTAVEPLADAEVKVPGVMAMLVAPVVVQPSVLDPPELMLAGLAVKALISGKLDACTVIVNVAVVDRVPFVAVRV